MGSTRKADRFLLLRTHVTLSETGIPAYIRHTLDWDVYLSLQSCSYSLMYQSLHTLILIPVTTPSSKLRRFMNHSAGEAASRREARQQLWQLSPPSYPRFHLLLYGSILIYSAYCSPAKTKYYHFPAACSPFLLPGATQSCQLTHICP